MIVYLVFITHKEANKKMVEDFAQNRKYMEFDEFYKQFYQNIGYEKRKVIQALEFLDVFFPFEYQYLRPYDKFSNEVFNLADVIETDYEVFCSYFWSLYNMRAESFNELLSVKNFEGCLNKIVTVDDFIRVSIDAGCFDD